MGRKGRRGVQVEGKVKYSQEEGKRLYQMYKRGKKRENVDGRWKGNLKKKALNYIHPCSFVEGRGRLPDQFS